MFVFRIEASDVAFRATGFETLVGTLGEAERALADLVGPRRARSAAQALARFEDVQLSCARYPVVRAGVAA
jgi:hypothetical protein